MTGAEQVIERIDETAQPSVAPPPSTPSQPRAVEANGPAASETAARAAAGAFSPDPARRTDRYRLVTPYCLRL